MALRRDLFATLISLEHLEAAVARAVRGRRRRRDVAAFLFDQEAHVLALRDRLRAGTWQPRRPALLYLRDPKPRVIVRSPVADRVVHAALALLCEPIILRSASEADYACRPNLGQHRAVLRLHRAMCEHRFALHLDVRSYFPSIRPDLVRALVAARIRDDRLLAVIDTILAAGAGFYDSPRARRWAHMDPAWPPPGRGLPMGSATSQLFAAHLYLQAFDHFVKRICKVPSYVRYVDDIFLFGDSRVALRGLRTTVAKWLVDERDLRLKRAHAPVLSCRGHLDALGMRIRRGVIEPLPAAMRRLRGRVGAFVRGTGEPCTKASLQRSLAASAGHLFFG